MRSRSLNSALPFSSHAAAARGAACCWLALGILSATGAEIAVAEMQPFQARVVALGAPVLSGPGDAYYATDTLAEGETVDIYRQQPDGWCAIRPPEGSFSWVYVQHLRPLGDSLAEVDKDDVASRIGSRVGTQRNAVQVRLKKGEVVQILGEQTDGGQAWYKIAPPAGEFRWIHLRHLQPMGPVLPGGAPAAVQQAADNACRATDGQQVLQTGTAAAGDAGAADFAGGLVAPPLGTAPSAPPSTQTPPGGDLPAGTAATNGPGGQPATSSASTPVSQPATQTASQLAPPVGDLAGQIMHIELKLSRAVAGPPETWNIAALEQEAEQLLAAASSLADREAVKATLAKIDRFAAIERRYARSGAGGPGQGMLTPPAGAVPPTAGPMAVIDPTGGVTIDGARYDAVGVLRPVVSRRPGAPQFALVDERGQVISFVTPTPDVNLQPYLGHRIGVVGNRGFMPEFRRAHVTAGRVTPLADRLVR